MVVFFWQFSFITTPYSTQVHVDRIPFGAPLPFLQMKDFFCGQIKNMSFSSYFASFHAWLNDLHAINTIKQYFLSILIYLLCILQKRGKGTTGYTVHTYLCISTFNFYLFTFLSYLVDWVTTNNLHVDTSYRTTSIKTINSTVWCVWTKIWSVGDMILKD